MNSSQETGVTVRLERIIPAPPHQVYRAWLEPELIGRWMSPGPMELSRAELDELAAAMPDVAKGVGPGWEDVLAKLAAVDWPAVR